jgi:hypothetical protein
MRYVNILEKGLKKLQLDATAACKAALVSVTLKASQVSYVSPTLMLAIYRAGIGHTVATFPLLLKLRPLPTLLLLRHKFIGFQAACSSASLRSFSP